MNGQRRRDPQPAAVSNAALQGASLAFAKPPVKPEPLVNTYTGGSNSALLAATKVGGAQRGSTSASPAQLTNQITGGSIRSDSRPNFSPLQVGSKPNSSSALGVPDDQFDRVPSLSNIAARLAAARYSPMPPKPISNAPLMMSERTSNERDMLPPTGSVGSVLARLHAAEAPPSIDMGSIKVNKASPPPLHSPKPQRVISRLSTDLEDRAMPSKRDAPTPPAITTRTILEQPTEKPVSKNPDDTKSPDYFSKQEKGPIKSPPITQKPVRLTSLNTEVPSSTKPPLPRVPSSQVRIRSADSGRSASIRRLSMSIGSGQEPPSPASFKSAKEQQDEQEKIKPSLPPPRRSTTKKLDTPAVDKSRTSAPLPAARKQILPSVPLRMPEKLSPPQRPSSARGASPTSVYHNNYQRNSVKQITQHMTGESLSSAIMGAALASSRNVSPAPPHPVAIEPLFPPPRKHYRHHSPFHRSPSPPKQSPPKPSGRLRTTMRKEPSSSENEDESHTYKKKGSKFMGIKGRKHPNKHHEGTRKRWRDQITERERRRYEGVWAANKGIMLPIVSTSPARTPGEDDPSSDVLNLSVQEIWRRSRLPEHVLEEVWDLVDGRGIGRLRRGEFVVGLWLVDQRLKGRKLPVKVSDSVWASARGVGIKVKVRK